MTVISFVFFGMTAVLFLITSLMVRPKLMGLAALIYCLFLGFSYYTIHDLLGTARPIMNIPFYHHIFTKENSPRVISFEMSPDKKSIYLLIMEDYPTLYIAQFNQKMVDDLNKAFAKHPQDVLIQGDVTEYGDADTNQTSHVHIGGFVVGDNNELKPDTYTNNGVDEYNVK